MINVSPPSPISPGVSGQPSPLTLLTSKLCWVTPLATRTILLFSYKWITGTHSPNAGGNRGGHLGQGLEKWGSGMEEQLRGFCEELIGALTAAASLSFGPLDVGVEEEGGGGQGVGCTLFFSRRAHGWPTTRFSYTLHCLITSW